MPIQKLYFVCPKFHYKNDIFDLQSKNNWDNALYPYHLLKEKLREKGIEFNTFDYFNNDPEGTYALLFFDFPRNMDEFLKNHKNAKKFLFVYESPIKNEGNQKTENYQYFDKVFTWNKELVDNQKVFHVAYARKFPEVLPINNPQKLATGIFGNKAQRNRLELYSERVRAIRWFEKNHLEDFDLYGAGWDQYYFQGIFSKLNKLTALRKLLKPNYPSYGGFINHKKEVYPNYKFSICYENSAHQDYITEKILDCLILGIVPVYLGAPNIADYVPKEAFIDKRDYKTYGELYTYLKNMPQEKYNGYISAIKNFVEGERSNIFKAETFANIISDEISKSLF